VADYYRGEVWMVNLNPAKGHEQAGIRPCLVVSADGLNRSRAELVIVIPITSKEKRVPSHVQVNPPEGGLKTRSFIQCEAIRSISADRLERLLGTVTIPTLNEVNDRLRILLNL
jgi:mRNA interferase MazF